ncbi:copper-binding protein [Fructobacillus pseudoficulneus]|uniref:Copper-binding protein n=1 Tax=Fructobacillus pseudoficulneus TaxID=220714 RepID=A0A3F3GXJ2_9LACO|nr:cupredoxin domain-containing protein [Fructobacillus pseudoficulneus]GAP03404.1 copper-binding protein [Fructobacillus pseudoficulneus]SEH46288.1 Cupredoxin-like domain-containing protein [Fructobacillus pseudoficulneus]
MDKMLVLVAGLAAIAFIVWWFFGKHQVQVASAQQGQSSQDIDIEVAGGYSPEQIVLKKGVPATLNFTRTDPSGCLDHVVFSDFGINQELPQGEQVKVQINTDQAGEYTWACGMNMFQGKVIIK